MLFGKVRGAQLIGETLLLGIRSAQRIGEPTGA
jgi:hypothetical protein